MGGLEVPDLRGSSPARRAHELRSGDLVVGIPSSGALRCRCSRELRPA